MSTVQTDIKIPFLDLSVKDAALKSRLLSAVDAVLTHGRIVLGPEVEQLEGRLADYCQRRYAVGVNSGTDALYLALRALEIGPGDEVITTPLSWIATANAIAMCGATPVFVDIAEDLNIDPELIEGAITPRTRAVLAVHFTGKMCDVELISQIADRHGIHLVEDAAQSFGARFNDSMAGSFGTVSAFSMNPMKVFNAYGEAGAVVTDDEKLRDRLVSLRYAGTVDREDCHFPSLNGRIDTIQAAMLLVSLEQIEDKISRRRAVAKLYGEVLGDAVVCPKEGEGYFDVYYTYTILAERRDELKRYLETKGIETKIQHPILMPYHTAYRAGQRPEIPVAEHLVQRILCIPAHEDIERGEAEYVADCIREFYGV